MTNPVMLGIFILLTLLISSISQPDGIRLTEPDDGPLDLHLTHPDVGLDDIQITFPDAELKKIDFDDWSTWPDNMTAWDLQRLFKINNATIPQDLPMEVLYNNVTTWPNSSVMDIDDHYTGPITDPISAPKDIDPFTFHQIHKTKHSDQLEAAVKKMRFNDYQVLQYIVGFKKMLGACRRYFKKNSPDYYNLTDLDRTYLKYYMPRYHYFFTTNYTEPCRRPYLFGIDVIPIPGKVWQWTKDTASSFWQTCCDIVVATFWFIVLCLKWTALFMISLLAIPVIGAIIMSPITLIFLFRLYLEGYRLSVGVEVH